MRFRWLRLRLSFTALERVIFPPIVAANVLRGAMGLLSRGIACAPGCRGASTCTERATCLYARVFEPAALTPGPSGLADHPRPFVFRARHLDGGVISPGEPFHFDLHVFTSDPAITRHLLDTFASLESHGLGPGRGKVRLIGMAPASQSTDLTASALTTDSLTVHFLSPTELKTGGSLATEPDFPALFNRARDRIATLSALYGPSPLQIDFTALGKRAAEIRMSACDVRLVDVARHSTRTGQTHSIGGFIGSASYEGPLTELVPWLQAAEATGVGRQAAWGKGEIFCEIPARHHLRS